jgi:hypothetical protein
MLPLPNILPKSEVERIQLELFGNKNKPDDSKKRTTSTADKQYDKVTKTSRLSKLKSTHSLGAAGTARAHSSHVAAAEALEAAAAAPSVDELHGFFRVLMPEWCVVRPSHFLLSAALLIHVLFATAA